MKKLLPAGLSIFITVFFLASCVSTNIFDDTLPLERSVKLFIYYPGFTVKAYNGIPVRLKKPFGIVGFTSFTIPAGETTLVMDMAISSADFIFTGKDLILTHHFEAGKEYTISFGVSDADGKHLPNARSVYRNYPSIIIYDERIHMMELSRSEGTIVYHLSLE
jgi:hypothetical protein